MKLTGRKRADSINGLRPVADFLWGVAIALVIIIVLFTLTGCSAAQRLYMVTPDWETGEDGWRYGVDTSIQVGTSYRDFGYESVLDVPVIRTNADGMEKHCGARYAHGCWNDDQGVIYLPSVIYAGHYELTHERLHAMGFRFHNNCAGLYSNDREHCESVPVRRTERAVNNDAFKSGGIEK